MSDIDPRDDFVPLEGAERVIAERMLFTLGIYPKLSYSMLQVGIGTAIPPRLWHPVLARLKAEDKIIETEHHSRSPMHRDLVHRILMLKTTYDKENPTS